MSSRPGPRTHRITLNCFFLFRHIVLVDERDVSYGTMVDTVRLYHGTSLEAAIEICAHGFLASVDGLLGRGVYLSASITKASRYAFSKSSHGGAILEVEIELRVDESIVDVDENRTRGMLHNVGFARIGAGCDDQEIRVRDPARVRVFRCHFGQRERAHEIVYRMQGDTLTRVGPARSDRTARAVSRRRRRGGTVTTRRVVPRVGNGGPGRNSLMEGMVRAADATAKENWHAPKLCGAEGGEDGIHDKEIARADAMPRFNACVAPALLRRVLPRVPFLLQVVAATELIDGVMTHQQYSDGTHRTPRVHLPPGMAGVEAGAVVVVRYARLRRAATIAPFWFKRGPIIEVVHARVCCGPRPGKHGPGGRAPLHLEPALGPEGPPLAPRPAHAPPAAIARVRAEPAPLREVVRRVREREFGGSPGTDERGPYPRPGGRYVYDFETYDKDYTSKLTEDVEEWNNASRDMGAALICSDDHPFGILALSKRAV
jgi:hypothetical protein